MTIKIKDKEYKLKYTLRAMIIFEKITKESFSLVTMTDQLVFLYSLLLANNPEMKLSMDDLIDEADSNPKLLQDYLAFLQQEHKKEDMLNREDSENPEDKKKE